MHQTCTRDTLPSNEQLKLLVFPILDAVIVGCMCGMLVSAGVIWPGCVPGGGTIDLVQPTGCWGTSVRGCVPLDLFHFVYENAQEYTLCGANGMDWVWAWLCSGWVG